MEFSGPNDGDWEVALVETQPNSYICSLARFFNLNVPKVTL
jgi:hypothetical protein